MILIKYSKNHLEVKGHANFKQNDDIVCAGVSGIIMGSINWFNKKDIKLVIDEIKPIIELTLLKKTIKNQKLIELIVIQLKSIEKKYSKYIRIKKGE